MTQHLRDGHHLAPSVEAVSDDVDHLNTTPLAHWQQARERDIKDLREQIRCLQLTTQRLAEAAQLAEKVKR